MCGIFFSCNRNKPISPSQTCLECLRQRGPDNHATVSKESVSTSTTSRNLTGQQEAYPLSLTFVSTVLSLRGDSVVSQPLEDLESGSLLCWNGEAWEVQGKTVDGNDAKVLFDLLKVVIRESPHEQALHRIVSIFSDVSGPFAFVFYDAPHHRVFYGRDALGRRSLAIRNTLPESVVISSVCDTMDCEMWSEVEADGIYVLHLQGAFESSAATSGRIERIPRTHEKPGIGLDFALVCLFSPLSILVRL